MFSALLIAHSLMRWIVLLTGLAAAGRGIAGWGGKRWTAADGRAGRFFVIALDIQFLLGLLLYVVFSPIVSLAMQNFGVAMRDPVQRFFLVEHALGMIVALALAHIGQSKIRKSTDEARRHRIAAVFFSLALLLILLSIPWPFMPAARPLLPW